MNCFRAWLRLSGSEGGCPCVPGPGRYAPVGLVTLRHWYLLDSFSDGPSVELRNLDKTCEAHMQCRRLY